MRATCILNQLADRGLAKRIRRGKPNINPLSGMTRHCGLQAVSIILPDLKGHFVYRMVGLVVLTATLHLFLSQAGATEPEQELATFEQKWAEAVQRNDPDEIGRFLHSDFTFVNPRGQLLCRTAHLDDFRNRRTVFSKVELSDVQIRIYGDFAVVTSRPKITGFAVTPSGTTSFDAKPARFTDTMIQRDGKWQSVARHMTLVSE